MLSPKQKWCLANPEKVKEIRKRYYDNNKEAIKARRGKQKSYSKTTDQSRDGHYRIKYGISLEQYNLVLERQAHLCAICGCPETAIGKQGIVASLCVDHCHTTKHVRGLLCRSCNIGLGNLQDSEELLTKAISYLQNAKQAQALLV